MNWQVPLPLFLQAGFWQGLVGLWEQNDSFCCLSWRAQTSNAGRQDVAETSRKPEASLGSPRQTPRHMSFEARLEHPCRPRICALRYHRAFFCGLLTRQLVSAASQPQLSCAVEKRAVGNWLLHPPSSIWDAWPRNVNAMLRLANAPTTETNCVERLLLLSVLSTFVSVCRRSPCVRPDTVFV